MNIKDIAKYALQGLAERGAQSAQCMITASETNELNSEQMSFSLMRTIFSSSMAIKAIVDGRAGTVTINQLDKDSVDAAIADCILSAQASDVDPCEAIGDLSGCHVFEEECEFDREKLFERIDELLDVAKKEFPGLNVDINCHHQNSHTILMNTNGTCLEYKGGHYQLSDMFFAVAGERSSSMNGYGLVTRDMGSPFIDCGMHRQLFENAMKQLDTTPFGEATQGTLLISPACLGDLLQMTLDLFTGDNALISGVSPWKNMLGKQVAAPRLTLSAMPLHKDICGGSPFNSDGYPTRNLDIIKHGVLESFTLSRYGAARTGLERADTDISCIVIEKGDKPLSEIVLGIDKGLVLGRFSGGSPNSAGDFSGIAKNSFIIENGKITSALSETMISGNLWDILKNIIAISCEQVCDGVSILPWIASSGVYIK